MFNEVNSFEFRKYFVYFFQLVNKSDKYENWNYSGFDINATSSKLKTDAVNQRCVSCFLSKSVSAYKKLKKLLQYIYYYELSRLSHNLSDNDWIFFVFNHLIKETQKCQRKWNKNLPNTKVTLQYVWLSNNTTLH